MKASAYHFAGFLDVIFNQSFISTRHLPLELNFIKLPLPLIEFPLGLNLLSELKMQESWRSFNLTLESSSVPEFFDKRRCRFSVLSPVSFPGDSDSSYST